MDDTDFIVRQVTYSNGSFRGSVVDHSHYSYEFHDANYFRFPCRVSTYIVASVTRLENESERE